MTLHGDPATDLLVRFKSKPEPLPWTICAGMCNIACDAWWEFLDTLLWKYNAGFMNDGNRISSPEYPVEWLERVIELDEPDHYKR